MADLRNITITSQADIDENADHVFNNIDIMNAQGILEFGKLTAANSVYVHDSPHLHDLRFPVLSSLVELAIENATALKNVSLPDLEAVGVTPLGNGGFTTDLNDSPRGVSMSLRITGAPALSNLTFAETTGFYALTLADVDNLRFFNGDILSDGFLVLTSIWRLSVDGCFNFQSLAVAAVLDIVGRTDCTYGLEFLTSVIDLKLIGTGESYLPFQAPLRVNGSLIADSLTIAPGAWNNPRPAAVGLISAIGEDANISSSSNVDLSLNSLATVGGSLFIYNNTNCTFSFGNLTQAVSLSMTDNEDSFLPWFPLLRQAVNIHMRGFINTSSLFPALSLVSDTVVIEPWNDDFNCSELVKQWERGIIHNLFCNGTNNVTKEMTNSMDGHSRLSTGAWAGIGVSIGVVVLVGVSLIVWLCFRFRHWLEKLADGMKILHQLSRDKSSDEGVDIPPNNGIYEVDGRGILREKPDDHIPEAGGHGVLAERPDNHIRELPVPPTELS
ncbi:hypothetical protein F4679DRAFT_332726 [Xylaria curta]|nr:hypothetical protein F4679DRAFT_332726 [Xylaria curta]